MAIASFWDVVDGLAELPPITVLLGFELLAVDRDAMTIEVGFTARPEFCNPTGDILVGVLAAMLDDTLGPALVATLGAGSGRPPRTCTSSSWRRPESGLSLVVGA